MERFSLSLSLLASSWGLAIVFLASYLVDNALAEYDCSAKDDGWYYDPEFCHIYWRCIHGASEEFECASGTAWDHHDNRCNWLDSVDCSRAEKTTPKPASDDDEEQGDAPDESNHDEDGGGASDDDTPVVVVSKTKKKSKKKNNRKLSSNKRMLDGDDNEDNKDKDRETSRLGNDSLLHARSLNSASSTHFVSLHRALNFFFQLLLLLLMLFF